jgi:Secretion system C-terminal sorting domain
MRKQLLLLLAVSIAAFSYGQIAIPNGNLESWTTTSYDSPTNYPYTSISAQSPAITVVKSTDAYSGTYAVNLKSFVSGKDTASGYFINTPPNRGPDSWTGGMAISGMPKSIRGYYKYNIADSACVILAFSKAGVNIGTAIINFGGIKNSYTLFDLSIPALGQTPDSVAVAFVANKLINGNLKGIPGTELFLDSVSFTGLASQPTLMNGDFEAWATTTNYTLDNWYQSSQGCARTTDHNGGSYAIELTSYMQNNGGTNRCEAGTITNFTYPNNCKNDCKSIGGIPFDNQTDTLAFYYKYLPANPGDSTNVSLDFKKNGTQFGGAGIYLKASSSYKLAQIPISLGQKPDSALITFRATNWQDSLLSFAGAKLIIDDIHFKKLPSLPTGLVAPETDIQIAPNPCNGKFHIIGITTDNSIVELYNIQGVKVYSNPSFDKIKDDEIDISSAGKGVYLLKVVEGNKTTTHKIVVE